MKGGTTTIITETMEVFPMAGYDGVIDFLESLNDQPIKIFATVAAMASISRAAMGVSSCHEPTSAEDALERLRLGFYVMAREGSIRRDLKSISRILDNNVSLRRLILTTDGISPSDLLESGYMEYPVQKAIDCGFNPVTAIQMATLNVAEHFGLDLSSGGLRRGKWQIWSLSRTLTP